MVPAAKLFEKLLFTPCPALCTTNDLLHQHGGDLFNKIIFTTYCLAVFFFITKYIKYTSAAEFMYVCDVNQIVLQIKKYFNSQGH